MAWTKKKTAGVSGIALLLLLATATTVVISVDHNNSERRPVPASRPDRTPPRVVSLEADSPTTALGQVVKIHYTVSDRGGSHLNGVELWRAHVNGTGSDSWSQIGATAQVSVDGPVNGTFEDIPAEEGSYWYGLHVTDHGGNVAYESHAGLKPVKVTVVP